MACQVLGFDASYPGWKPELCFVCVGARSLVCLFLLCMFWFGFFVEVRSLGGFRVACSD